MAYSIVQTTEERPSADKLRVAFRAMDWLIDIDADILVKSGYGIVAERLPFERANELSAVLARHGVPNEVVADNKLPMLGVVMQTRRLDCLPDKLVVYDPLGRPQATGWDKIRVAAAGIIVKIETKRRVVEKRVPRYSRFGGMETVTKSDVTYKNERNKIMHLELFLYLDGAPRRYRARHDNFQYNYLGSRQTLTSTQNFTIMLGDISERSETALFNLGFQELLNTPDQAGSYPNMRAFEEEIKWLLWRQTQR